MSENLRSQVVTQGVQRSPNRAMLRAVGFQDEDFNKAIVGIANGYSTITPCNMGIATLADSAFAFACNAYNEVTVASGFDISIVAPAHEGDVLRAVCSEQNKTGRTGVYDVEVRNQAQQRIALFRGRSYTLRGKPVVA